MKLIDLHCDTILNCINSDGKIKLNRNDLCIDIRKLKRADSLGQLFALFVDLEKYNNPMDRCLYMIDGFYREIEENSEDIAFAGSIKN